MVRPVSEIMQKRLIKKHIVVNDNNKLNGKQQAQEINKSGVVKNEGPK